MREIKFRAWDRTSKKMGMVQVRQMLIPDGNNENGLQELAVSHLKVGTNPSHWLITPILMQYTGLKDKNGKEIYEGDILGQEQFLPWGIKWDKAGFYAYNLHNPCALYPFESATNREVIGNIYSNPELLKEV